LSLAPTLVNPDTRLLTRLKLAAPCSNRDVFALHIGRWMYVTGNQYSIYGMYNYSSKERCKWKQVARESQEVIHTNPDPLKAAIVTVDVTFPKKYISPRRFRKIHL